MPTIFLLVSPNTPNILYILTELESQNERNLIAKAAVNSNSKKMKWNEKQIDSQLTFSILTFFITNSGRFTLKELLLLIADDDDDDDDEHQKSIMQLVFPDNNM